MDNKNILKNIELYNKIQKNKTRVKTIEIGLDFLDEFFKEIKEIELLSSNDSNLNLISIYNYKDQKFIQVTVSSNSFKDYLQFFYHKFLNTNYFSKFSWYISFCSSVKKILSEKYQYQSVDSMNLIISFICECFKLFSNGHNSYNYDQVNEHLFKIFNSIGININESKELSNSIIENLFSDELLVFTSSFFSIKKTFKLSDPLMDVVFFLNTISIASLFPNLSSENEEYIKIHPKLILDQLPDIIDNYTANWHARPSVIQLIPLMLRDYPNLMKELLDYSILDLNYENLKNIPEHVSDVVRGFFFYKILLNEYFLQLIILSCFDFEYCFLHPKMKNILYPQDYRSFFNLNLSLPKSKSNK